MISVKIRMDWLIIVAFLATILSFRTALASSDETLFMSFEAEFNYWTYYSKRPGVKAFAIGPFGNHATALQGGTQKQANSFALSACNRNVASDASYFHVKIKTKCVIFAEGDRLLLEAPWGSNGWQAPALGVDHPLLFGRVSRVHYEKPLKGIVIQLHGCDGLGGDLAAKVWGKYLNSLGFNFFGPNSFSDPRPEAICGVVPLSKRKVDVEIMRIRLAQTLRSIQQLKSEKPDVPIYVWGHSEGAFVAMALEAKVSGVILSGEECDAYALPFAIPESVPILFIYGDHDPYFNGVKLPLSQEKLAMCQKYIGNRKLDAVVVKNAAHFLRPWRPEVSEAFSRFLTGSKVALPLEAQHVSIDLSSEAKNFMIQYSKFGKHKAFAAHPDGTVESVSDVDYKTDAENFAAFQCDFDRGINPFVDGKHSCTLQDVDGVPSPAKP